MTTGTTRATPVLLWSRAVLLALVVLAVSVVGHVSADGLLPGPGALLVMLAVTSAVAARFLVRQASAPVLVALLVSGQAAVHGALTLLAGHAGAGSPRAVGAGLFVFDGRQAERTGSYFDQVAAMQPGRSTTDPVGGVGAVGPVDVVGTGAEAGHGPFAAAAHLVDHLAEQGAAMVLAHLAAVVLLGAWLAVGERALWTVLTLSTTRLLGMVAHLLALVLGDRLVLLLERVRRLPSLVGTRRDVVPLPHLLHHVVAHRGPPALLAV